jgi:predicted kinase
VREYLEGVPPGRAPSAAQRLASLAPGFEEAAYDLFFASGEAVLGSGRALVLDGGFPTAKQRAAARDLARRSGVPFHFIECRVDAGIAARRLAERDEADALDPAAGASWRAVYDAYAARFEPPDELPADERMVVDTTRPLEESVAAVAARLPLWPEEHGA